MMINNKWQRLHSSDLHEAGVLKDLVRISNQFELLHDRHRFIQIQDNSRGCDAEISLQTQQDMFEEETVKMWADPFCNHVPVQLWSKDKHLL